MVLNFLSLTIYVQIETGYAYRHHLFYSKFGGVVTEKKMIELRENQRNHLEVSSQKRIFAARNTITKHHNNMKTTGYLQLSDDGKILMNCTDKNVSSVVIPNGVTEIGRYAFDGCTGLTSVEIPSSVTKIGRAAFSGCMSLTSVKIPNSVTWIEDVAFCGCISLTSVEVPSSVTEIGDFAFSYCTSLEKFIVDEDNPNYCVIDGSLLSKSKTKLVSVFSSFVGKYTIPSSVTEIGKAAFDHCTSLTSVEIPSSVKKIGENSFCHCTSLTSVEIPSSVTEIGWGAFGGCTSLTSVNIPSSVAEIGEMVFSDCTNLTSVEIPDSVTEIGRLAFDYCTSLIELHCRHKKPLDALSECFEGVDVSRITLYVPSGSVDDYRHHPFFSRFGGVVNDRLAELFINRAPIESL